MRWVHGSNLARDTKKTWRENCDTGCLFGVAADGAPPGAKHMSASDDVLNSFMQTESSFTILGEQQRRLRFPASTGDKGELAGAAAVAATTEGVNLVAEVASEKRGHARKSSGGGKKDRASKKKGAKSPKPQAPQAEAQAEAEAQAIADVKTRASAEATPPTPERNTSSGGDSGSATRQTTAAASSAPAAPAAGGEGVAEEVGTGTPAGGAGGKRVSRMERMQVRCLGWSSLG